MTRIKGTVHEYLLVVCKVIKGTLLKKIRITTKSASIVMQSGSVITLQEKSFASYWFYQYTNYVYCVPIKFREF